ncbi:MAG TPA: hypothetical protein VMW27_10580, partial [Thermoanaerobaculia bacterium]|nr:hypothetical protein [Thermoanaerobaculia bacterium]
LPLQVTRRAAREIQSASEWWDENRPSAPDAFRDAIEKAKPKSVEVVALWHTSRYPDLNL